MFAKTTIIATLAISSLAGAFPASTTSSTDLVARAETGTATYCSAPGVCASIPIDGSHKCITLDNSYSLFTFSDGLSCTVYKNTECRAQWFKTKGRVRHVKGSIDLNTNEKANKNNIPAARSFRC